ncbi:MAG TPA: hypothetical protein DD415_01105 [Clostridiales bacterium]|nr:hypothetical protein [Clostridiales bacterium]
MKISEVKKTNKYVTLVTYLIAVVCLLLGLFLPLWGDKGILALQLPKVLNALAGKDLLSFGKDFTLAHRISLFGIQSATFDIIALLVIIYAVITVLALLALIPVGFSVKNEGRVAKAFAYVAEIAAAAVLSVYAVTALPLYPEVALGYNMFIALGGCIVALIVLCIADKGATGVAKLFLFLFSAVALLMLFDFTVLIPKLAEPLKNFGDKTKLYPYIFSQENEGLRYGSPAYGYIKTLFEGARDISENGELSTYFDMLKGLPSAKEKATFVLCTILALVVIFNYLVDLVSLSTNGKKAGHIFNMARYSLEVATLVCLYITILVMKANLGLFLVIISAMAVIQLLMSVVRFLINRKKVVYAKPADSGKTKKAKPVNDLEEIRIVRKTEAKQRPASAEQLAFIDPPPAARPEPVIMDIEEEARPDGGEQLTINEAPRTEERVRPVPPPPVKEAEEQPEKPKDTPVKAETVSEAKPAAEEVKPQPNPEPKPTPAPAPAPAPAPEFKPQPEPAFRPQPEPVRVQPTFTEQPAPAQNNVETRIYTINTIYGGPSDDFLKKLTNDEKIEFARTFIEKSNGVIGNIPDYVIGGNNKKFFSSVFIYLGRIRGMISDGLLNKMYKELNMM